ncbi:MAG: EAL domain-containing protein [Janthinobacterium lividum]
MPLCKNINSFSYSGINILTVLKPDIVKLDIEMIRDVDRDNSKAMFVQKIIEACHSLNAKVLAEGIETANVAQWCLQNKVDYYQGFYFSRPVEIDHLKTKGVA